MARSATKRDPSEASVEQASLVAEPASSELDQVLAGVMHRLGIYEPLTYERRLVPLQRVVIPQKQRVRAVSGYTNNIKVIGVLHDPAVTPITGSDDFLAVFGRHRLLGALGAGMEALEMRIYPRLDQHVIAFLRLSEQRRRTHHWISELEEVIEVIDDRVGLTEHELATSLGVPLPTMREYLKMARLPYLVRETVLGGSLAQATVRQMIRMPSSQQQALEAMLTEGQSIDAQVVQQLQRQRYTAALSQVPLVTLPEATDVPCVSPDPTIAELVADALALQRHIDGLLAKYAGVVPLPARVTLGSRMLSQELAVLAQTPPAVLGGVA